MTYNCEVFVFLLVAVSRYHFLTGKPQLFRDSIIEFMLSVKGPLILHIVNTFKIPVVEEVKTLLLSLNM